MDREAQGKEHPSLLIGLKTGGARNLFLVHDADGDTQLYLDLARRMPDDLAIFGITAGVPHAHTSIEEMANSYVEAVRMQQSHGPFILGGMCAGGVIAYEMATQLLQKGEAVELVVLLDAATPQASKWPARRTKERLGRLKAAVARSPGGRWTNVRVNSIMVLLSRNLVNAIKWEITQLGQRLWGRARFRLLRTLHARGIPWPKYVPELSLRQIYECAEARYLPRPLCGARAALFRARRRTPIPSDTPFSAIYADKDLGWGAIVQDFVSADVDGGHGTMLQEPFVGSLVAALLPQINRKFERAQHPGNKKKRDALSVPNHRFMAAETSSTFVLFRNDNSLDARPG